MAKDFPLVQGAVMLTAAIYLLVNLLTDVSYAVIDPRIKH
jgi:peptide/nickel transport system permease protein